MAFYAKGQILGKWLLTMAYDSGRNPSQVGNSLFQTIDPQAWYTLYGDGSQQGYDAASARKIYLKLEREHWAKLRRMVLRGPKACGFERELWTLPMVREFIQSEFGVEYHEDHLSRFMRRLGLSAQKPMARARERDEKAIKRFVEVEFPAIEKKRGGGVPR